MPLPAKQEREHSSQGVSPQEPGICPSIRQITHTMLTVPSRNASPAEQEHTQCSPCNHRCLAGNRSARPITSIIQKHKQSTACELSCHQKHTSLREPSTQCKRSSKRREASPPMPRQLQPSVNTLGTDSKKCKFTLLAQQHQPGKNPTSPDPSSAYSHLTTARQHQQGSLKNHPADDASPPAKCEHLANDKGSQEIHPADAAAPAA
jgi:hypothetical protein